MNFWFSKFFALNEENSGAEGSDNVDTGSKNVDTTDYKALYEQLKTDKAKLKTSFDKTASELAELKKSRREQLNETERAKEENAEREQHYLELEKQLCEIRTANAFAKHGYAENDYNELSSLLASLGDEKSTEIVNSILAFVEKANKTAVASAINERIKTNTILPSGNNTSKENYKYAQMAIDANKRTVSVEKIQEKYK